MYLTWFNADAQRPLLNHTIPYSHNGNSNALPSSSYNNPSFRSGRDSYAPPPTPDTDFELYKQIKTQATLRPIRGGRPQRVGSALAELKNQIKMIEDKKLNRTDDDVPGQRKQMVYRPSGIRKNSIYDLRELNRQRDKEQPNDEPQNGELVLDYTPPRGMGSLNIIKNNMTMLVSFL